MVRKLKTVLATMDSIELHGKDNIDMFLGCILTIEQVISEMQNAEKEKIESEEEVITNG